MPATDRRLQLKATLLDCAERAIADGGLPAVRARELAQAAGCAVGAIYNVFPDLDALVLTVNLRTLALLESYVEQPWPDACDGVSPGWEAAITYLVGLATSYVAFAGDHPQRWRALFQHRMNDDKPVPDWYVGEQRRLFQHIEGPLKVLCPELADADRHLLARTLFSATHGVVSLGFDQKLLALPIGTLRSQVVVLVRATAVGLAGASGAVPGG